GLAKTEYIVYAENIQPEEMAKILQRLATGDKKATWDPSCEAVHVSSLTAEHRSRLGGLLGLDGDKDLAAPPLALQNPLPKNAKDKKDDKPLLGNGQP